MAAVTGAGVTMGPLATTGHPELAATGLLDRSGLATVGAELAHGISA